MKCFSILVSLLPTICQAQIVEWDHGYKTDYVIATRYRNPHIGFNIGFRFPKQPYDSDRMETFEFIAENGDNIYQGGGAPGAELFVIFKGVKDKESANVKLIEFLPKLDAHMRSLH